MGERLAEQVAAGEISEADAKARFEEGEKRMWMRYRAAEERNATRGKSEVDYEAAVMKMTEMVKNGEITKEQMQQRLDRMKRAGSPTEAADRIDLDELKAGIEARIKAMGERLAEQVAAGEISEADAKARFEEGEKRMWMRYRAAEERNATRGKSEVDYEAAVMKMTEMVKNGEITKEQMQQRLDRMKRAGSPTEAADRIDLDELKAEIEERLRAMGADLRKQVAAGEISEEDAKARFDEGEQRMWMRYRAAEAKNADAMKKSASGRSRTDYDAAVKKMTEMVKNGEMTREQMQQRLDRMKQAESRRDKEVDR